ARTDSVTQKLTDDSRNSSFLFERTGLLSDVRYDKIHLVPFGEFLPFGDVAWLHKFLLSLTPYKGDYSLQPGGPDAMSVFRIDDSTGNPVRFVPPICFEDIFGEHCARMFRPAPGSSTKRADILVNLTNDGWYRGFENAQHLQAAIFRSIENRVPTARSVN